MPGHHGVQALAQIPPVFGVQGAPIVFQMAGHEDLAVVQALSQGQPGLAGLGQDAQIGHLEHVLRAHFGMP